MASIANTYARAFADAVMDGKLDPEKTLTEARTLANLLAESRDLRQAWETPSIPADQKRKVLDVIAKREGFSTATRNFMAVVIDNGRVAFLGEIVAQFEKELGSRLGFVDAEITSARELNAGERASLEAQAAKLTGKKIRAHYLRDASLLGGALMRVGSTIYDGSVKGKLERIRAAIGG
jgi:F-type H+-transporting ATPase subunit delta